MMLEHVTCSRVTYIPAGAPQGALVVPGRASVADYYNGFRDRLVKDYEVRNRRVVAAIEFAIEALAGSNTVLDVGCGIGWSTADLADSGKQATGLDISPVLIDTARDMFGDRCDFIVGDFATADLGQFDAVLMIDVYEHFPLTERPAVHRQLARVATSRVVLTVPTPQLQQAFRAAGVDLQPVDEPVTDEDIAVLAEAAGGRVVIDRTVSVWRPDDYRHVLIERNP